MAKKAAKKVEKKAPKAKAAPVAKKAPEKKAVAKAPAKAEKKAPEKKAPEKKEAAVSAPTVMSAAPVKPAKPAKVPKPPKKTKLEREAEATARAVTEGEIKWAEYHDKYSQMKALPYSMSQAFEEKTPIMHKVLGWGFILSILNDRLEVIFKSGTKTLISNYKS